MEPSSPSDPKPPQNQWPWVVGSAVVIAGLLVAIALFSASTHRVVTVYVTQTPSGRPVGVVTSPPAPASPAPGTSSNPDDAAAQKNLDAAAAAAGEINASTGSLISATPLTLAPKLSSLTFDPPTASSTGPDNLSISIAATTWSASALSKSGTCWWVRFESTTSSTTYGTGLSCTGQAAAGAAESAWPASPGESTSPSSGLSPAA